MTSSVQNRVEDVLRSATLLVEEMRTLLGVAATDNSRDWQFGERFKGLAQAVNSLQPTSITAGPADPTMCAALSLGIPAGERPCDGPTLLRAVAAKLNDMEPGHGYVEYLLRKADAEEAALAKANGTPQEGNGERHG